MSFFNVPFSTPLLVFVPIDFLRFLTKPTIQNINNAAMAAAIQPNAAYKPPGNSNSFLAVPHSSSDSS